MGSYLLYFKLIDYMLRCQRADLHKDVAIGHSDVQANVTEDGEILRDQGTDGLDAALATFFLNIDWVSNIL